MKKHIKFPSIDQFRNIKKTISDRSSYVSKDENGESIFDYLKPKPVLTFTGTIKLHGTNASVCYNDIDGIWVQSRENIITPEKDNMGCAWFCKQNEDAWLSIIKNLVKEYNIDTSKNTISIYFEWAGKGIQKGVGISEIEKSAFIFSYFKSSPIDEDSIEKSIWLPTCISGEHNLINVSNTEARIYNICDYKLFVIDIDFNDTDRIQNEIIDMTIAVEDECPVAKEFGFENTIGEGIVFETILSDGTRLAFKSKGEKHSNSKVKTIKAVDMEKLDKIDKCIEQICHTWRFQQGIQEIFGVDYENTLDRKRIGEYLKWVTSDTLKEESDIIAEFGFEPKDIMSKVSQKAKEYFFSLEK